MKILVIGGGGREHALVWKLRQSPAVARLWCAPGNGGISNDAECIPANTGNIGELAALAQKLQADLTIVGPELPLVAGIADEFAQEKLAIVGPSRAAAQLEGSKIFAKQFMLRQRIPTADLLGCYESFAEAGRALAAAQFPLVIKADGLCAGKGVLVATSLPEARDFLERLMVKGEFGEGGRRVILEKAIAGKELSLIVLTDGEHVAPLVPARDHKRVFDGDQGPNTGGMGAYSTDDLLPAPLLAEISGSIVQPAIRGMAREGNTYRGFLYFGLMLTPQGATGAGVQLPHGRSRNPSDRSAYGFRSRRRSRRLCRRTTRSKGAAMEDRRQHVRGDGRGRVSRNLSKRCGDQRAGDVQRSGPRDGISRRHAPRTRSVLHHRRPRAWRVRAR